MYVSPPLKLYVSCRVIDSLPFPSFWWRHLGKYDSQGVTMAQILEWKERKVPRPPWEHISPASPTLKTYWAQWDLLEVREGILIRRWESDDGKGASWLTVLPNGVRSLVLQELHTSNTAAHFGMTKTLARVKNWFYWAGMASDIRSFIRQCTTCAQRK